MCLPISLLLEAGFQKCQLDVESHSAGSCFPREMVFEGSAPNFSKLFCGFCAVWLNQSSSFLAECISKLSLCCRSRGKGQGELWVLSTVPWQVLYALVLGWGPDLPSGEERGKEKMQNGSGC